MRIKWLARHAAARRQRAAAEAAEADRKQGRARGQSIFATPAPRSSSGPVSGPVIAEVRLPDTSILMGNVSWCSILQPLTHPSAGCRLSAVCFDYLVISIRMLSFVRTSQTTSLQSQSEDEHRALPRVRSTKMLGSKPACRASQR